MAFGAAAAAKCPVYRGVLISAVVKSTQTWHLGQQQQQKVSCLSRCPHFSGCKEHTNMAFEGGSSKKCPVYRGVLISAVVKSTQTWHLREAAAKSVLFIEVS